MATTVKIAAIRHPRYSASTHKWKKWRLTYEGGEEYLDNFLFRFSEDESPYDFAQRKRISYVPAFAKNGVLEIRNSIYQRMADISRKEGPDSYQKAIIGKNNGVDLLGSSMNAFIGLEVLPELLFMSRVGVYVDMPPRQGDTMIANINIRPYLYSYAVEDILSWREDDDPNSNAFVALLLRDYNYTYDENTALPNGSEESYRYYYKNTKGEVWVEFYNENSEMINNPIRLNVPEIPFVIFDIGMSLLNDICEHQISMMNLASSDMQYCRNANFPFYTEQFDSRMESFHLRRQKPVSDLEAELIPTAEDDETGYKIKVGSKTGRRYPMDAERPGFIHPSSEPMQASMSKQDQLKNEIRTLLHLSLSSLGQKINPDSDQSPLESGLSYIGMVLEDAERQIGRFWSMYENQKTNPSIHYPTRYSLKTDQDRFNEADQLQKRIGVVPSDRYKREISKKVAMVLLGHTVDEKIINQINKEIDAAAIPVIEPSLIDKHVTIGILDPEAAAAAMHYPKDSVAKAQEFQAKRLKLIRDSQTPKEGDPDFNAGARGVDDESVNPEEEARLEKEQLRKKKIANNEGKSISNEDRGAPDVP